MTICASVLDIDTVLDIKSPDIIIPVKVDGYRDLIRGFFTDIIIQISPVYVEC